MPPEVIGCSPQMEIMDLTLNFERLQNQALLGLVDNSDDTLEQMGKVQQLLAIINNQRNKKDSKDKPLEKVDCNSDPELIALVDEIRTFGSDLIKDHTYIWKGEKEIDALVDNLVNFAKMRTTNLSQVDMNKSHNREVMSQIINIANDIIKMANEGNKKIINSTGHR